MTRENLCQIAGRKAPRVDLNSRQINHSQSRFEVASRDACRLAKSISTNMSGVIVCTSRPVGDKYNAHSDRSYLHNKIIDFGCPASSNPSKRPMHMRVQPASRPLDKTTSSNESRETAKHCVACVEQCVVQTYHKLSLEFFAGGRRKRLGQSSKFVTLHQGNDCRVSYRRERHRHVSYSARACSANKACIRAEVYMIR